MTVNNRVALVTGGSGGLGVVHCLSLAAAGFKVAVAAHTQIDKAKAIVETVMPDAFVTTSSFISPQFREFERFTTAALAAFIGSYPTCHKAVLPCGRERMDPKAWFTKSTISGRERWLSAKTHPLAIVRRARSNTATSPPRKP